MSFVLRTQKSTKKHAQKSQQKMRQERWEKKFIPELVLLLS